MLILMLKIISTITHYVQQSEAFEFYNNNHHYSFQQQSPTLRNRNEVIWEKNKWYNHQQQRRRLLLFGTTTTKATTFEETIQQQNVDKIISNDNSSSDVQISFSHVHLYVDKLEDIHVYKGLEDKINQFGAKATEEGSCITNSGMDITKSQTIWNTIDDSNENKEFIPQNRDLVKQLILGLGFRITGMYYPSGITKKTRTLLLTSIDPGGVQFVISAIVDNEASKKKEKKEKKETNNQFRDKIMKEEEEEFIHFNPVALGEFHSNQSDRQGIAVLAFEVCSTSTIELLYQRYKKLHPKLLIDQCRSNDGAIVYDTTKVLEVYAYYKNKKGGDVDYGTRLRFIAVDNNKKRKSCTLPGLESVAAIFDTTCYPAYSDHWVSNVINRTGFLETLEETLGFTPKVDFNAGVVAAGEAQIESTVTGNDSSFSSMQKELTLRDQSQVYLPINNALSDVGHVHGFLQQIGQGIQHVASRVDNLAAFVQRANDFRKITGEGFTFLKIPRSYYGVLTMKELSTNCAATLTPHCTSAIIKACEESQIITPDAAVNLDLSWDDILSRLRSVIDLDVLHEFEANKDDVVETILNSRYSNLYSLLGDNVESDLYLALVRNQVLVDVQDEDLLFQIFTCNILQRREGDEAPFFEFIQRVCSECIDSEGHCVPIKAGCGGFGIRNFLTLFLSIEVGKAMLEVTDANLKDDDVGMNLAQRKVDLLTDQMNESNPILTEIADAMATEGKALFQIQQAEEQLTGENLSEVIQELRQKMELANAVKIANNEKLMSCSAKYNELMKALRVSGQ